MLDYLYVLSVGDGIKRRPRRIIVMCRTRNKYGRK
jgi:hypothetical protein